MLTTPSLPTNPLNNYETDPILNKPQNPKQTRELRGKEPREGTPGEGKQRKGGYEKVDQVPLETNEIAENRSGGKGDIEIVYEPNEPLTDPKQSRTTVETREGETAPENQPLTGRMGEGVELVVVPKVKPPVSSAGTSSMNNGVDEAACNCYCDAEAVEDCCKCLFCLCCCLFECVQELVDSN